ncbi:MAG: hypothetical protein ABWY83_00015 [Actinomycetota bacterium]
MALAGRIVRCPTVCWVFMRACGLVNVHVTSCFRYAELCGT